MFINVMVILWPESKKKFSLIYKHLKNPILSAKEIERKNYEDSIYY